MRNLTATEGYLPLLFFFHDTATTEIYTLSLHDALPISAEHEQAQRTVAAAIALLRRRHGGDRKSTRLKSSHRCISYAVFCLKKKKRETCKKKNHSINDNKRQKVSKIMSP